MNSFLKYVAQDLYQKYGNDLSHVAVVFPNKRASIFLNEYLAEIAGHPIWSPAYITISELFRQQSRRVVPDQIKLVSDLYKTFIEVTGQAESLDGFYGWGLLLLSDFDDIDKNLAETKGLFYNITGLHEHDDISYLTDRQKAVLEEFFGTIVTNENSKLQQRFKHLWEHLGDIYEHYNTRLSSQNLAYEGALYREVIETGNLALHYDTYLFVGFNMLQKVEQRLFSMIRQEARAEFYWDYDKAYVNAKKGNEAGHFIKDYLCKFSNAFGKDLEEQLYNNLDKSKDYTFINAPTEDIQARYISSWLTPERIEAGKRTAIVLAEENLLPTVIHCLPDNKSKNGKRHSPLKVNVTLGYPLASSPIAALVSDLIMLQTYGLPNGGETYRLKYVLTVLRHPYARFISDKCEDLITYLTDHHRLFPSRKEMQGDDEGLTLLFTNLNAKTPKQEDQNLKMTRYLMQVIRYMGCQVGKDTDSFFQESLFRMYTLMNRLRELMEQGDMTVQPNTYQRLMTQIMESTTIPFHGEPAEGIQIMGVLETRNLDFDHVLLLSCNEGNLPKGVNDASFIPHIIRQAFELTTIEHKVAIYAYYFYRLLQRGNDITLSYNSSTDDGQKGEMSRFMLQLLVDKGKDITCETLQAGQITRPLKAHEIAKTDAVMQLLLAKETLSPSAINAYLRCQLRFFYNQIANIKEPEPDDTDDIDPRMFGNIFHRAAQLMYDPHSKSDDHQKKLNNLFNAKSIKLIKDHVLSCALDQAFAEELFKINMVSDTMDKGNKRPRIIFNSVQEINHDVMQRLLRRLLDYDGQQSFTLYAQEYQVETEMEILVRGTKGKTHLLKVGGIIDRLDEVGGQLRVIDYKTGRGNDANITDMDAIFDPDNIEKHSDYYLQTMLYACIVSKNKKLNPAQVPVAPGLLFIQQAKADRDYSPILKIDKQPIFDIKEFEDTFYAHLQALLQDIFDASLPFKPVSEKNSKRCVDCPYLRLCQENR